PFDCPRNLSLAEGACMAAATTNSTMILHAVNGSVTLDAMGVTIRNSLFGCSKTIAWGNLGGASVQAGTWLARPKFIVLTRAETAMLLSGIKIFEGAAGREMAEWFLAVPAAGEAEFRSLAADLCERVERMKAQATFAEGESVVVRWRDGQSYVGIVSA